MNVLLIDFKVNRDIKNEKIENEYTTYFTRYEN